MEEKMNDGQSVCNQAQPVNKMDILNFIRVGAIMMVFLLHARIFINGFNDCAGSFFDVITCFPAWGGVWILFFLSGYLIELGFLRKRYNLLDEDGKVCWKAFLKFYLKRFLGIAPAYYIYILLFLVLNNSTYVVDDPVTFLRIITFTFNGANGIEGIGHLWYVSVAMWLYLLAPFIALLIDKIKKTWIVSSLTIMVILIGFGCRLLLDYLQVDWYTYIYTFLPMNFDLFISGMLICAVFNRINGCVDKQKSLIFKIISMVIFVAAIYLNNYFYASVNLFIYRIIFPSIYILVCAFLIYFWKRDTEYVKPTKQAIKENPFRVIDKFSGLTYYFYLFHIVVFMFLKKNLALLDFYNNSSVVLKYFTFIILSFMITLLLSILFSKLMNGLKKIMR